MELTKEGSNPLYYITRLGAVTMTDILLGIAELGAFMLAFIIPAAIIRAIKKK